MTPKITAEQRDALNQHPGPVLVQDDETKRSYYLVDPTYCAELDLIALQRGIADADAGRTSSIEEVRARLDALMREHAAK